MPATSNSSANYEVYWSRLQESARYHPSNRFRYSLLASRLKRYLRPGMSVLDMGCGDARLLLDLKSQWPLGRFAGCDISHTVIDYNRERHPDIGFFQADVSAPGLIDKAAAAGGPSGFDIVISTEVIEHIENNRGLLQNGAALLVPGGIFILTTQSGPRDRIDFELVHHLRYYRRSDLEGLVRCGAGDCRVLQLRPPGFQSSRAHCQHHAGNRDAFNHGERKAANPRSGDHVHHICSDAILAEGVRPTDRHRRTPSRGWRMIAKPMMIPERKPSLAGAMTLRLALAPDGCSRYVR